MTKTSARQTLGRFLLYVTNKEEKQSFSLIKAFVLQKAKHNNKPNR